MTLTITHNAGFFSCCSLRLHYIINYINLNSKIPNNVDSSNQYQWYKLNNEEDIIQYFKNWNKRFKYKLKKHLYKLNRVIDEVIKDSLLKLI